MPVYYTTCPAPVPVVKGTVFNEILNTFLAISIQNRRAASLLCHINKERPQWWGRSLCWKSANSGIKLAGGLYVELGLEIIGAMVGIDRAATDDGTLDPAPGAVRLRDGKVDAGCQRGGKRGLIAARLADAGGLSNACKDGRAVAIVGGCVRRMQAVERQPSKLVRGEVHLFREPDADELTEAGRLRIDIPAQPSAAICWAAE